VALRQVLVQQREQRDLARMRGRCRIDGEAAQQIGAGQPHQQQFADAIVAHGRVRIEHRLEPACLLPGQRQRQFGQRTLIGIGRRADQRLPVTRLAIATRLCHAPQHPRAERQRHAGRLLRAIGQQRRGFGIVLRDVEGMGGLEISVEIGTRGKAPLLGRQRGGAQRRLLLAVKLPHPHEIDHGQQHRAVDCRFRVFLEDELVVDFLDQCRQFRAVRRERLEQPFVFAAKPRQIAR
jgi:hypothetical protein